MVCMRPRCASVLVAAALLAAGCLPEEPLTAEDLTVQVPTGDGQAEPLDNSEWLNADPPDTTPFGPFDASGLNMAHFAGDSGVPVDAGGDSTSGDDDDGGSGFAALVVSGAILYSGAVSGTDHQILEGGYPELHLPASSFATVGMDESLTPVGLTIPGFAGLPSHAIDVTPIGEPVEDAGANLGPWVEVSYEVTPRVWTVDESGFHGEFDIRLLSVAGNGAEIRGNATHTLDGSWQGSALSYSATTAYHCELALDAENILFIAHQTFELTGTLRRE